MADDVLPADEVAERRDAWRGEIAQTDMERLADSHEALRAAVDSLEKELHRTGVAREQLRKRLSGRIHEQEAEVESLRATVARLHTAADDYLNAVEEPDDFEALKDENGRIAFPDLARSVADRAERTAKARVALRAALDATTAEEPTGG